MRLIGQLSSANAGTVVGGQAVKNTFNNRHAPLVLGDFLLVRQFHTIHANQATMVNSPRRKPLCRRHDVVELRFTEVRPKRFYAPGKLRVNHPAVKNS